MGRHLVGRRAEHRGRAGVACAAPVGVGPYGYAVGQRVGPVFAGFWQRVGATLLDGLILGAPGSIIMGVLFALAPTERRPCFDDIDGTATALRCAHHRIGARGPGIYFALMLSAVILYYGLLEGKTGQTIGKRALGIKTVRRSTGEVPGVGRAIRANVRPLSLGHGVLPRLPVDVVGP